MRKLAIPLAMLLLAVVTGGCGGANSTVATTKNDTPQAPAVSEPPVQRAEIPEVDGKPPEVTEPQTLFSRQHLTRVEITMSKKSWDALRHQTRSMARALSLTKTSKPFTYFSADVRINGKLFKSVGVRKKGFIGSLDRNRPSLKIKLNEFESEPRDIEGYDRLTLNNNKQDRSLVSQYLGYHVFRQAGLAAPRCNLAHVTVNGQNLGIYSNVEPVKAKFIERAFGSSKGALYEGTLADFFPDRLRRFELKINKKNERARERTILKQVAAALSATDQKSQRQIMEFVDLEYFTKFWVVESILGFWDGYSGNQNNFFVYHDPADGKLRFIPWGLDSAFTNRRFGYRPRRFKSVFAKGLLAVQLNRDETARSLYQFTQDLILDEVWKEEELLADVNRAVWLVQQKVHSSQESFGEAQDEVRKFIDYRREEIEAETENGPVVADVQPRRPMHSVVVGKISGSFATKWHGNNGRVVPQVKSKFIVRLQNKDTEMRHFNAIARMGQVAGWRRRRSSPSLHFSGQRLKDGEQFTAQLYLPAIHFRPLGGRAVRAQGRLWIGDDGGQSWWRSKMLDGRVIFKQAKTKSGADVIGTFDMDVYEMRRS